MEYLFMIIHWPTILEKRSLTDGRTIYGVICKHCSDEAEDYVKCQWLTKYPDTVTPFTEPLK